MLYMGQRIIPLCPVLDKSEIECLLFVNIVMRKVHASCSKAIEQQLAILKDMTV